MLALVATLAVLPSLLVVITRDAEITAPDAMPESGQPIELVTA